MSFHKKLGAWATSAVLLAAAGGFAIQPALAGTNEKEDDAITAPMKSEDESPTRDDGATVEDAPADEGAPVENNVDPAGFKLLLTPDAEPVAEESEKEEPAPEPEPTPSPEDGAKDEPLTDE